jgi:hypothetical protein
VEELRKLGHDVLTIQETGKANQSFPDDGVLQEQHRMFGVIRHGNPEQHIEEILSDPSFFLHFQIDDSTRVLSRCRN